MSQISTDRNQASPAHARRRRPRAHEIAGHHSQRVRFLRRAIVITCVSVVALIGFVLAFDPLNPFQFGNLSVGRVELKGTRIEMDRSRLSGKRNDGQAYEISAEKVVQDTLAPRIFELTSPEARLGGPNGSTTLITASAGHYDSGPDTLDLKGPIRIFNKGRYDVRMTRAEVDMRAGKVVTRAPVEVSLANGRIWATAATFEDSAKVIFFEGRVRTTFDESGQSSGMAQTTPEQAAPTEAPQ